MSLRDWLRRTPPAAVPAPPAPAAPPVVAEAKREVRVARMREMIAKLEARAVADPDGRKATAYRERAAVLRNEIHALALEEQIARLRAGVVVEPGTAALNGEGV